MINEGQIGGKKLAMLATTEEKRSSVRHHLRASIVYASFNTDDYHDAEVVNVSEMGMSFRSRAPLKPGVVVFIRMGKYSPLISNMSAEVRPRSVTLAEVKWCRESISKSETQYDIGVIYLFPDR